MVDWTLFFPTFAFAALLSLAGFLASVILFLLSRIISSQKAENDAKKEVMESAANLLLVFMFLPFLIPVSTITTQFALDLLFSVIPQGSIGSIPANLQPGHVALIASSSVFQCVKQVYPGVYLLQSITSTINLGFKTKVPGLGVPLGFDFEMYASAVDNIMKLLLFAITAQLLWIKLLLFGVWIGPLLIAIGFALRAFPPLRGAGGYMLALGISIYFIMPIAYLFAYSSIGNIYESCQLPINQNTLLYQPPTSNNNWGFLSLLSSLDLTYILDSISEVTARIIVNFCFLPLFAVAVALTTTNIGSTVFGARLSEIGRGLIKLI
ncbi:MAG: hypothetical protein D6769_03645 [Methanobacteriota archaeon]|nr:MAG: hypothetical protein D6769_03645 [Euryarchaeota archaeon]